MLRRRLLRYEWSLLGLSVGTGAAWSILSLFALEFISFPPAGPTTIIAYIVFLPAFLAGIASTMLHLSIGLGLVLWSGALFGLIAGLFMVGFCRWQNI